ncbi:MAG: hypothetical protein MZV63_71085 [Marinilabiliales bacterium]|nr:hypothetical protein [Marinilabiliales bacterium]
MTETSGLWKLRIRQPHPLKPPSLKDCLKPVKSQTGIQGPLGTGKSHQKEEKNIDGYVVASACVKGINNFLGWEMELEQASNNEGEPVAVNFSSSLISCFSPCQQKLYPDCNFQYPLIVQVINNKQIFAMKRKLLTLLSYWP